LFERIAAVNADIFVGGAISFLDEICVLLDGRVCRGAGFCFAVAGDVMDAIFLAVCGCVVDSGFFEGEVLAFLVTDGGVMVFTVQPNSSFLAARS